MVKMSSIYAQITSYAEMSFLEISRKNARKVIEKF